MPRRTKFHWLPLATTLIARRSGCNRGRQRRGGVYRGRAKIAAFAEPCWWRMRTRGSWITIPAGTFNLTIAGDAMIAISLASIH